MAPSAGRWSRGRTAGGWWPSEQTNGGERPVRRLNSCTGFRPDSGPFSFRPQGPSAEQLAAPGAIGMDRLRSGRMNFSGKQDVKPPGHEGSQMHTGRTDLTVFARDYPEA